MLIAPRSTKLCDMKRVLLVEDDSIFLLLATKILERIGFSAEQIQVARTGKEAIDIINDSRAQAHALPDVILLDLKLPVMDGFEFLSEFNKMPERNQSQVIIVTSSINPDDAKRADRMGISEYITKPMREDTLRSMLPQAV